MGGTVKVQEGIEMKNSKQLENFYTQQKSIQEFFNDIRKYTEEKLNAEGSQPDEYDIFEDRLISLLIRWRTFHDNNKDKIVNLGAICVKGVLDEINDEFTQDLLKGLID